MLIADLTNKQSGRWKVEFQNSKTEDQKYFLEGRNISELSISSQKRKFRSSEIRPYDHYPLCSRQPANQKLFFATNYSDSNFQLRMTRTLPNSVIRSNIKNRRKLSRFDLIRDEIRCRIGFRIGVLVRFRIGILVRFRIGYLVPFRIGFLVRFPFRFRSESVLTSQQWISI